MKHTPLLIALAIAVLMIANTVHAQGIYIDHTPIHPWPQDGFNGGGDPEHYFSSTLAKAQRTLKGLGYYKGSVDGAFGEETSAAIQQYQADNGIPVTGRLDNQTLVSLGPLPNPKPLVEPKTVAGPIQPVKSSDGSEKLPAEVNRAIMDAVAHASMHNYAVKDAPMTPVVFRPQVVNVQGGYAFYKGTAFAVGKNQISDVLNLNKFEYILKDSSGGAGTKWNVVLDLSLFEVSNPSKEAVFDIKAGIPKDLPDTILPAAFKATLESFTLIDTNSLTVSPSVDTTTKNK